MLKVSASYLEKQKSFIPKKNFFLAVINIITKKTLFTDSIFRERFARELFITRFHEFPTPNSELSRVFEPISMILLVLTKKQQHLNSKNCFVVLCSYINFQKYLFIHSVCIVRFPAQKYTWVSRQLAMMQNLLGFCFLLFLYSNRSSRNV